MEKKLVLIAVVAFLIPISLGMVLDTRTQTLKACYCSFDKPPISNTTDGEVPCNSVSKTDYLYFSGVINIYQEKHGTEILMCENGERTGEKVRYDEVSRIKANSWIIHAGKIIWEITQEKP